MGFLKKRLEKWKPMRLALSEAELGRLKNDRHLCLRFARNMENIELFIIRMVKNDNYRLGTKERD